MMIALHLDSRSRTCLGRHSLNVNYMPSGRNLALNAAVTIIFHDLMTMTESAVPYRGHCCWLLGIHPDLGYPISDYYSGGNFMRLVSNGVF